MSRVFETKVSNRMIYADTSKKEVTWYRVLTHYDAKYDSTLRVFQKNFKGWWFGRHFIHFRDSNGYPNVFNVEHDDDDLWLNANYANPDNVWNGDNRFVFRSRKSLHFSPTPFIEVGEFCFRSCPFQPPSIFPTSSILSDRVIYFLLSMDFVSHKTIKSIFVVSTFRIARRTYGCFSCGERKLAMEMASILSTNKLSILCPSECL